MDAAMLAHLSANGGGGEEGGSGGGGLFGILHDSPGLGAIFNGIFSGYGLEGLLRRILTAFPDGKCPFDIGKRGKEWFKKFLKSLGEGFSQAAQKAMEHIGGHDHSPASPASHGLSGDHGGGHSAGSGISYDH